MACCVCLGPFESALRIAASLVEIVLSCAHDAQRVSASMRCMCVSYLVFATHDTRARPAVGLHSPAEAPKILSLKQYVGSVLIAPGLTTHKHSLHHMLFDR